MRNQIFDRLRSHATLIKMTASILVLIFIGVNSIMNFTVVGGGGTDEPHCVQDKFIDITRSINNYLKHNVKTRSLLMIITFGLLDLSLLICAINWIFKSTNWRLIINLTFFFIFRLICNSVVVKKDNEELLWVFPGIYSFAVSYVDTSSKLFSGLAGLYAICGLDLYESKQRLISLIPFLGVISYFILSISLRAEYYLSLFAGVTAAHYLFLISKKYHLAIENYYSFLVNKFLNQINKKVKVEGTPLETKIQLVEVS